MSANTVISVKEIPVLGEKKYENVSKTTIIRWIEEMKQIRRAHPEIDTKLCILHDAGDPSRRLEDDAFGAGESKRGVRRNELS